MVGFWEVEREREMAVARPARPAPTIVTLRGVSGMWSYGGLNNVCFEDVVWRLSGAYPRTRIYSLPSHNRSKRSIVDVGCLYDQYEISGSSPLPRDE